MAGGPSRALSPAQAIPLGGGGVAGAGAAVPGAVGVPGQAAVGTGFPVHVTAVQRQVRHAHGRGHVQLLLLGTRRAGECYLIPTALGPCKHPVPVPCHSWDQDGICPARPLLRLTLLEEMVIVLMGAGTWMRAGMKKMEG